MTMKPYKEDCGMRTWGTTTTATTQHNDNTFVCVIGFIPLGKGFF